METWGFAISFETCQPENRSQYIHVEGVLLVKGPDPSGPRWWPVFVIGSLYLSTSGINEYLSRKLLVSGIPIRGYRTVINITNWVTYKLFNKLVII